MLGTFGIGAVLGLLGLFEIYNDRKRLKDYMIILGTALPFLLGYWLPLIVVYHAKTPNPYQELVMGYYGIAHLFRDVLRFFLMSGYYSILSLVMVCGLYALIKGIGEQERLILKSCLLLWLVFWLWEYFSF